jgi:hypothetical protein
MAISAFRSLPGAKLKFSYLGMSDVVVPAKSGMKVTLHASDAVQLGGVEVVAYGVQKKVTVTGALLIGEE